MSGSVDDEIVRMRFDNTAFERGVATTMSTLSKLKSSLSFSGADKGLDQIEAKANKFSLSGMSNGIGGISKKFLGLSAVALTALSNITNRAVDAGIKMVKSFTLDPIMAGFKNYETRINAVQTILANTGLKGKAGLATVNKSLEQLNTYANKTVYNFSEMAKNIGTFTAAGVKLKPATNAIKGIANLAALSGSNSQQASTAMYQLSQAISSGQVKLQDWNSVVNAGIGGKVFQKALFNTGVQMKTIKGVKMNETFDQWTAAGNTFRGSLQSGWVTGKVLTNTLSQFTGDLTNAQLKSQGYNATQIKQIQELAKTANNAATKIKTFSQLTDALKEEVATAYGAIFKTIFGDITGATKLFSGIHTVVENALTVPIYSLNTLLEKVSALGGRAKAIDAFKNVFKALGAVLKPITQAFRDIFPAKSAKDIANAIATFDAFTKKLTVGKDTADKIKRTFAGFFAVLDIGKQIVMGIFHAIASLFGAIGQNTGSFLGITANVGDMVVAFDKALKKGGLLKNFFQILGNILQIPLHILGLVGSAIGQLFSGFHAKDAKGMTDSVTSAGDALGKIAKVTGNISDFFGGLASKIQPGVQAVVQGMQHIGSAIASGFSSQNFANALKVLQTGFLAGIVLMLKKFIKGGVHVDVGGGLFGKVGEMVEGVTGNLKAMQQQLKAKALLEIAAAMGILALAMIGLAAVDPKKLAEALKAMAIGFGELLGAMAILTKISGSAGFIKIPLIAASMDLLAGAILLLTTSVLLMSRLSWDELKKGLTGVGALLAGISAASIVLSKNSGGMIRAGVGIAAMAVGLDLLYLAVKGFSTLSWGEMLKGLSGVGIALVGIAATMRIMPRGMVAQAAAILLIAAALQGLYLAVKSFATLSYSTMLKGLVGIAGSLTAIALAMRLMPPSMIPMSLGLIAVGAALQLIAKAVDSMGKMSWSQIGKGLTTLAGSLAILAIAMYAMTGTIAGAAALLVVATALHIFVPALMALGSMSWGRILKGLLALAASFVVIGAAGLLLTPVIPGLLGLGVALGLVGVAMLAFGAGASLLGVGLTAIAASGGAAISVLLGGLKSLILLLPVAAKNIATALVSFITIIGKNAPQIIGAFVSLLKSLLEAVPKLMPSFVTAITSIVKAIIKVLLDNAPRIIQAGLTLLLDLLKGISNNIGKVVGTVALIIVRFLNAVTKALPKIIKSGADLIVAFLKGIGNNLAKVIDQAFVVIVKFLNGIAKAIDKHLPEIIEAGVRIGVAIVHGLAKPFTDLLGWIWGKISHFFSNLWNKIKGWFGIHSPSTKAAAIGKAIVQGIWNGISGLAGWLWNKISGFFKNLWKGIKGFASGLKNSIVTGISSVFGGGGTLEFGGALNAAFTTGQAIGNRVVQGARRALKIESPSKEFIKIGQYAGQGLINGLQGYNKKAGSAAGDLGDTTVQTMKKTIRGLSKVITDGIDSTPVIAPVLDLTQFRKDATQMGGLINTTPIKAEVSYAKAADISASRQAAETASAPKIIENPPVTNVKFEQNNYSPESLSTVEIYRRTNNQISQAKKALGISS